MNRRCSIPGCQGRHGARGWCYPHYKRWLRHGDPTAGGEAHPTLTPQQVKEMKSLAAEGLSRSDIAAITGWSVQTVGKHVGHIVRSSPGPRVDYARYRRMLQAAAGAQYGARHDIASRFGLKNAKSLNVTLVTARRRIAEAEGQTR